MLEVRLADLLRHLDAAHARFQSAVARVPEPLRRQRPEPDRWSAVEVVEHVGIVEHRLTRMLAEQVARLREGAGPRATPASPPAGGIDPARFADRSRRFTTRTGVPTGTVDEAAAWAQLEHARRAFRDLVASANGLPLEERVQVPHPAFGLMTLYEWMAFIAGHEERHAWQVDEIHGQLAASVPRSSTGETGSD